MKLPEIDYGSRLRAGLLIPSGNSVAEPELRAMLPVGVSTLVTRLPLRGSSEAELMQMLEQLEPASRLLADAGVDVIVFHCTAVSTFVPALAEGIRNRIQIATNTRCFTTADAIVYALRWLDAKRVTLLTPYIEEVHAREISFLEQNGFFIDGSAHLGINSNGDMAKLSPEEILEWARDKISPRADACLISCTAIKSAPMIRQLEQQVGIPILTSNQCAAWHLLASNGIDNFPTSYGPLLTKGAGAAAAGIPRLI